MDDDDQFAPEQRALIEREKALEERLFRMLLNEKGIADPVTLAGPEYEALQDELDQRVEARFQAGTLGKGITERECLEDEWADIADTLTDMGIFSS